MKIEVSCSECQSVLRVSEEHRGKQLRCPVCEHLNPIPISGSSNSTATPSDAHATSPYDDSADANFDYSEPVFDPQNIQGGQATNQSSDLSTSIVLGILGIVLNMSCGGCLFPILFFVNAYGLMLGYKSTSSARQTAIILNVIAMTISGFWILVMLLS